MSLIFLVLLSIARESLSDSPESLNVVTISQGKLKGFPMTTDQGKAAVKFQGIPYAEAPLGNLRFKHPKVEVLELLRMKFLHIIQSNIVF